MRKKCDNMEDILEAKINSCTEFRQSLINSLGKRLVEAIKSDIFWSSGLNPSDSSTTKAHFYPGQNRLGHILKRVRSNLLLRNKKKSTVEHIHDSNDEAPQTSDTATVPRIPDPTLADSSSSTTHPQCVTFASTHSELPQFSNKYLLHLFM